MTTTGPGMGPLLPAYRRWFAPRWQEGETEHWAAGLQGVVTGATPLWRLARVTRNGEVLEELPPLNLPNPTRDQVVEFLSQHMSRETAEACYEARQLDRQQ